MAPVLGFADDPDESRASVEKTLTRAEFAIRKGQYWFAEKLLSQVRESNEATERQICRYYFDRASVLAARDCDFAGALEILSQCVDAAREAKQEYWQWKALGRMGGYSNQLGQNLLASRYHELALKIAADIGNIQFQQVSKIAYARACIESGAFEKAEELLGSVQPSSFDNRDPVYVNRQICLAKIDVRKKNYDSAKSRLLAIQSDEKIEYQRPYEVWLMLGRIYIQVGELEKAESCYTFLLEEKNLQFQSDKFKAIYGLASVAFERKDYAESLKYIEQTLNGVLPQRVRLSVLAKKIKCYIKQGKGSQALQAINELDQLERRFQKSRVADELRFLEKQSDYEKTIQKKLDDEKDLILMKDQLQLQNTIQALGFAVGIIVLSGIVVLGALVHRRRIAVQGLVHQKLLLAQETKLNAELKEKIQLRVDELEAKQKEQIQLEQQLGIKRRDEALGKLTGGVAHDFNNLIMVIDNVNELIRDQLGEQVTQQLDQLLACSEKATKSAEEITSRLLAFAKRQTLQPRTINLESFFYEYQPLIRQTAGSGVRLDFEDIHPVEIFADETQLLSAIINMCANSMHALETTKDNPTIRITAREISFAERALESKKFQQFVDPETEANASNSLIEITVSDNGKGMCEFELGSACDPFFSTKNDVDGLKFGGTGLGLSVVKGFLEQSRAGLE
ncbi:MAG: ATP-binding protein, partial [Planctomycetota bacterium]